MKGYEFPDESNNQDKTDLKKPNFSDTFQDDEFDEYEEETEYSESNNTSYEKDYRNANLYQNANIEDVIREEDLPRRKDQKVIQEKTNELSDDDLTELEVARIKEERRQKIKNVRAVFLAFMCVVMATLLVMYNNRDKSKGKIELGPIDIHLSDKDKEEELEITTELKNYYDTRDKTNVEKILVNSESDPGKLAKINDSSVNQINLLIDEIILSSKDSLDYDNKMIDLNSYMTSLNSIRINDAVVLKDSDFNNLKDKINSLKNSSSEYFNALNYYSAKDYNNAINIFNSIPEDNYFHRAANTRVERITEEIIGLLNSDIDNLSTNIEYLDVAEKKVKYSQIKSIIEQYNKAYPYLHLENNQTYIDLLNKYTELSS